MDKLSDCMLSGGKNSEQLILILEAIVTSQE